MDIRYLESLISVAEQGSIASAARAQNLTPAAVGQRIALLEKHFGTDLLNRNAHRAIPTEACLRLFDQRGAWEGREHFLAIAATVMRRVLADHARRRRSEKRGGDMQRVTLDGREVPGDARDFDLMALDAALEKLAGLYARQARIVEMRYLAGMTVEAVASSLEVSRSTVEAEWRMARAWLHRELGAGAG